MHPIGVSSAWSTQPGNFTLEALGDRFLCYHHLTAETHLLNAFPGELLGLVTNSGYTTDEIAAIMAPLCDVEDNDAWKTNVSKVLCNLAALDLVTASTP